MGTTRFKELWVKYNAGTLLDEERIVFEELLLSLSEAEISKAIDEMIEVDMGIHYASDAVFEQIEARVGKEEPRNTRRFAWVRYAAAVLIAGVLSVGIMKLDFWKAESTLDVTTIPVDITLPDDKALVKLGDGSVFVVNDSLDRLETKDVAVQRIGEGVYRFDVLAEPGAKEEFLSFSTPKGVSNQVILSDGTKIWLNSSSQLLVSSNYKRGTRKVKLVGEAYFDVAKQPNSPFEVESKETKIWVLGTVFNIRSLADQSETKTTLSEGSVRVSHKNKQLVLKPGQQAITLEADDSITILQVDVDQEVGWKEGYFRFSEQPLEVILSELARWYDIDEVVWKKRVRSNITLSFGRTRSLSDILKRIERVAKVQIEVEERRIIVK
ncbi:FecR family protein [Sphingobacterium yanglingense]|uniref:FecR family protein n=1 Tax=Sphingobacterium yanglingense TaxID=1437280 RepID=A0A4R6W1M0_9SPHI|nr:FecR family protein [Sphingobacterium yanglingense]TDQ72260.1 FecR family protein [Sphingobacterium yanglingense]